jgi:hypothetical protein
VRKNVLEEGPFSGVFLAGDVGPRNSEQSALLVRIPYLGSKRTVIGSPGESRDLSEYRSMVASGLSHDDSGAAKIPVHEALFIVFNNGLGRF